MKTQGLNTANQDRKFGGTTEFKANTKLVIFDHAKSFLGWQVVGGGLKKEENIWCVAQFPKSEKKTDIDSD